MKIIISIIFGQLILFNIDLIFNGWFSNVLSIIVPWALYAVTEKYAQTYVRLKSDKDRYYKHNITYCVWHFKSIIKKDKYLAGIQLHFAEYFNHIQTNNIKYVLPDGINAKTKINFDFDYSVNEEKINNKLLDNKSYIDNIANNIFKKQQQQLFYL